MQIFNVLIEIGRVARRVYVYMLAHSIDFFLVRSRLLILLSFFFLLFCTRLFTWCDARWLSSKKVNKYFRATLPKDTHHPCAKRNKHKRKRMKKETKNENDLRIYFVRHITSRPIRKDDDVLMQNMQICTRWQQTILRQTSDDGVQKKQEEEKIIHENPVDPTKGTTFFGKRKKQSEEKCRRQTVCMFNKVKCVWANLYPIWTYFRKREKSLKPLWWTLHNLNYNFTVIVFKKMPIHVYACMCVCMRRKKVFAFRRWGKA